MSDKADGRHGGGEEHVRALLGELGPGPGGAPMPPAVASRLEDTIARLAGERTRAAPVGNPSPGRTPANATGGDLVPLRRRRVTRLAAAAAAVIVLGGGGVAAVSLGVFGEGSTASEQNSASAGSSADASSGAERTPELSSESFAAEVTMLLRSAGLSSPAQRRAPQAPRAPGALGTPANPGSQACPGPRVTDGAVPNPVRLDGRPAVLLVHPARSGHQLVEAWSCSGDRRLAGATLTP